MRCFAPTKRSCCRCCVSTAARFKHSGTCTGDEGNAKNSPLAGGFLSGRLTKVRDAGDEAALHKSRFAADSLMKLYTDVFDKPALHEAMHRLAKVCEETGTTPAEASLRWLIHHSTLGENDAVIVGARSVDHVVNGVAACRKAPLDEKTLAAVEQMWTGVDGTV